MKKRYFMGIDVAKATLDFCLLRKDLALLWRGQLCNDSGAIEQFLAQTAGARLQTGADPLLLRSHWRLWPTLG